MKSKLLLRTLVFTFSFSLSTLSLHSQWVSIPDTIFGTWLNTNGYSACMQGNNALGWQMDTTCPAVVGAKSILCIRENISDITGIQYFDSLEALFCRENQINNIPSLPNRLTFLECGYNQLSSLPPLPNSLIVLNCLDNQLSSLPPMPDSLTNLVCRDNQLSSLPVFPSSLILLNCINNQLTSLPALPNNLFFLFCGENQLTSIPTLPDSLSDFYCNDNPNLSCLPPLKKINDFRFYNTQIVCLPNYPQANLSSNPPLDSVPICDVMNTNGCFANLSISGSVYEDSNNNCFKDSSESTSRNVSVQLWRNGARLQRTTTNLGFYSFKVDSLTNYEVKIDTTELPFTIGCPNTGINAAVLSLNDSVAFGLDFGIQCNSGFDLAARSISGRFRPGDISKVEICVGSASDFYGINCGNGISGTVDIKVFGPVTYLSPIPGALTPVNVSGNVLTYNVADFGNTDFCKSFSVMVQTDTTAPLGSQICFTVTVTATNVDAVPSNNTLTHCFTVVGSYDPNDKTAYPAGDIDTAQEWLTYTVRFQNTGTAKAQHIYITDTLDSNLDVSSFQLLAYSHQPMVQLKENAVRFNFPNINLPDSNTNEPLSHGYVQYKIKLKDNLPIGTAINNTAFIYFDFNAPVVTNTTTNTIAVISGLTDNRQLTTDIRLFPNPASDMVTISIDESMIGATAIVTDVTGRRVAMLNIEHRISNIEVEELANGVYFVTVTDKEGRSIAKKLVINK